MPRRKSIFQRLQKTAQKRFSKLQKTAQKRVAKFHKARARQQAKLERRASKKAATKAARELRKLETRRARLQDNRARGGISKAAREHIGTGSLSFAEAIIISRLEKKGTLKDYNHAQIKDMALRMIGARGRSVGFIAAGWLGAIEKLARALGVSFHAGAGLKAFNKNAHRRLGTGVAAVPGSWKPVARIVNKANAKNDHKQALIKYGQPALQQAFDDERKSMIEEIEKRMKASAQKLGIRTR